MIDLSAYPTITSALLVKIVMPSLTLTFSDYNNPITYNGYSYVGAGRLLSITDTVSELKSSSDTLTISLSGIPNSSISEIVNGNIKGSKINVYRALINPSNGSLLPISGNPIGRFTGIVNNYGLEEEWDVSSRTSRNVITIISSSLIAMLNTKITGRRTNPADQKLFYPNDVSMDRVTTLINSNFQFGAEG